MEISLLFVVGFLVDSVLSAWWIWLIYGIHRISNKKKGKTLPRFWIYLIIGMSYGILITGLKLAGRSS